ncbi:MAG TPA: hypothetical protein VFP55_07690 [Solirubrobacteraceae bacterium]|nr:hypothetical protein [Solirubrobacteraceae bacterium]
MSAARPGGHGTEPDSGIAPGTEVVRAVDGGAADRGQGARVGIPAHRRARIIQLSSPHAGKFRLVTGILLGIGVAALALAVALASQSGVRSGRSQPWSPWAPSTGGKLGATEIAEHVAPYYRLTAATQLDVVTLINLANPNAQGTGTSSGLTVAINTGTPGSTSSLSLLGGSTIAYNLCGTGGHDCQLPGAPSAGRMLLLRREALELALYTFKYIGGASNVICVLPPGRTQVASTLSSHLPSAKSPASTSQPVTVAVVFLRQELQPWLNQPLSSTLSQYPPLVSELPLWQKTSEAGLVDQITARGLFSEQIESQQTGGNLLVLNQLPPQ